MMLCNSTELSRVTVLFCLFYCSILVLFVIRFNPILRFTVLISHNNHFALFFLFDTYIICLSCDLCSVSVLEVRRIVVLLRASNFFRFC